MVKDYVRHVAPRYLNFESSGRKGQLDFEDVDAVLEGDDFRSSRVVTKNGKEYTFDWPPYADVLTFWHGHRTGIATEIGE